MNVLNDFKDYNINSIIFKVTNSCNLDCQYCYRKKAKLENKQKLSLEILEKAFRDYSNYIEANNLDKTMNFVWHGGEPLIVDIDFYNKIISLQKNYIDRGFVIHNAIQTNGTLIDNRWIEFFKNNKFIIGISLDGPKFIHDKHRLNRKGYSSFEDTINGILLLKQCNISINIISVINNDYVNYGGQILEYFVDLGINVVDFIPCYFYNDRYTLSVENYKNFMINIFDIWMKKYKNVIKIRFLNDIFQNILRKYDKNIRVNVGCELGEVCGRNYSISVNGDIFPCECLTPIDYMKLGNIKEEDFISILKKREFNEFKELYNNVSKDCLRCDILDICHAGCLNRRLPQYTYNLKDYYCEARKGIIYHILNNLDLYFPKRKI